MSLKTWFEKEFDSFTHDLWVKPEKNTEEYKAWEWRMTKREVITSIVSSFIVALIVALTFKP